MSNTKRLGDKKFKLFMLVLAVAGVIYLLSQSEASWINGEVIRVDGGEHISGSTK